MNKEGKALFERAGMNPAPGDVLWALQVPTISDPMHTEAALIKLAMDSHVGRKRGEQPVISNRVTWKWYTEHGSKYLLAFGPKGAWVK